MNIPIQIRRILKSILITIYGGLLAMILDLHFGIHGAAIYFLIGYATMGLSMVILFYDDYIYLVQKFNIKSQARPDIYPGNESNKNRMDHINQKLKELDNNR